MVARCKPLTKDHLPLKTTFPGTKGWSVVTGFTVTTTGDAETFQVTQLQWIPSLCYACTLKRHVDKGQVAVEMSYRKLF